MSEKVKLTKGQAEIMLQVAKMVKDIPAKKVISALENGYEIVDEKDVER